MAEAPTPASDSNPENLLDNLVQDAMRVAAFGQRAGMLKNSVLFDAIGAIKAKPDLTWGDPSVTELQKAVNDAAFAIRPVTLVDLHTWDPFSDKAQNFRASDALRFVYVILAIILISAAIHYTQWLKRAEAVVLIQEQDLAGQLDQVIEDINDSFLGSPDAAIEALTDPAGGPAREALRDKLRSASRLAAARWEAHREYNLITDRFYMLWSVILDGNFKALRSDYDIYQRRLLALPQMPPRDFDPNPCRDVVKNLRKRVTEARLARAAARSTSGTTGVIAALPSPAIDRLDVRISEDGIGIATLRCLIGADQPMAGSEYDDAELKQKIETVGLWLLPGLFGAFGAVVYHLRACWNRLRPDPRLGRAMLRVFLGAFGGIAFGWFWSPDSSSDFLPDTLPLGAFAVAFLIGYSIDIFFALLDKLVATISGAIERIGRESPAN